MISTLRNFGKALMRSTVFYTKPVKSSINGHTRRIERGALLIAVLITNILGLFFLLINAHGFTLVNVGSFLGAVLCMLPSHFNPIFKCIKGLGLIALGSFLGILFSTNIVITSLLFMLGLIIAGILWRFSIGEYIRFLFFSFAIIASAEIRGQSQIGKVLPGLLAILLGIFCVSLIFCLLYRQQNSSLKVVSDIYKELYLYSEGKKSDYIGARLNGWSVIELSPAINFMDTPWLMTLLKQADIIYSSLSFSKLEGDANALKYIASKIKKESDAIVPDLENINENIKVAVNIINDSMKEDKISFKEQVVGQNLILEIKGIFVNTPNSHKTFIMRLLFTGFLCHLVSILLTHMFTFPLGSHGFWIPLSGCLMVMPGYYGTFGKVFSRTIGSLLGCLGGVFIFNLLPYSQLTHLLLYILIGTSLIILYGFIKSLSQAFLMFSVTLWLSFVLGGYSAGYTRALDVIVAALITLIVIFIIPTYHDEDFQKNLDSFYQLFINLKIDQLDQRTFSTSINELLSAQEKLNSSIKELQFDSSLYKLKCSVSELSEIQKSTEALLSGAVIIYFYSDQPGLFKEIAGKFKYYQELLREIIYEDFESKENLSQNLDNVNKYDFPELRMGIKKLQEINVNKKW